MPAPPSPNSSAPQPGSLAAFLKRFAKAEASAPVKAIAKWALLLQESQILGVQSQGSQGQSQRKSSQESTGSGEMHEAATRVAAEQQRAEADRRKLSRRKKL